MAKKEHRILILKSSVKKVIPAILVRLFGSMIVSRRSRLLSKLSSAQAFDKIYKRGFWKQGHSLSGLGSEGKWADDYCTFVGNYIRENGVQKIVDAGCGDFSVGERLLPLVKECVALDISRFVIEQNRLAFNAQDKVTFQVFDITKDAIPACDLLLVRQVLQHLSNEQIECVLLNIEASSARKVLITEHAMCAPYRKIMNSKLGMHYVGTRVSSGSGVDIGLPPFSRSRTILKQLQPGMENRANPNSALFIYELVGSR